MVAGLYWIDGPWQGRLAIVARPRGGDWLEDEVRSWACSGLQVIVSLLTAEETAAFELTNEADLCRSSGIEFVSFPIPDREVPSSRTDALRLVKGLDEYLATGKAVGIHCRQGIGRSGLVAACLLVSSSVPLAVAFNRISEARGRPIPETNEQREWVQAFAPQLVTPK